MDPNLGVVSASLGQLALHYGLISPEEHASLVEELRMTAQHATPDSCARLLIRRGVAQRAVAHLLNLGADLGAVLCDACGEAVPQGEFHHRVPFSCRRCGCVLYGFHAFAHPVTHTGDSEETEPLPYIPPPRESSETDRYDMVLPLPNEPALAPGAGRDEFAKTLLLQTELEGDTGEDMNQTLGFAQVFALPAGEAAISDNDATVMLEAMLSVPPAQPSAAPALEDDPRMAETVFSQAALGPAPSAQHKDPELLNAETLMASPEELGIRSSRPEEETLVASAEDLGLKGLISASRSGPAKLPERTGPLATTSPELQPDPALWPWLLALGLLCFATAIALAFAVVTSN